MKKKIVERREKKNEFNLFAHLNFISVSMKFKYLTWNLNISTRHVGNKHKHKNTSTMQSSISTRVNQLKCISIHELLKKTWANFNEYWFTCSHVHTCMCTFSKQSTSIELQPTSTEMLLFILRLSNRWHTTRVNKYTSNAEKFNYAHMHNRKSEREMEF